MQPELERRHHTEVATATAQGPEQIGLGAGRDLMHGSVGRDDGGAEQVVDRHAKPTRQPAEATAEREAGHPGGGVDAERRGQAMGLRLAVKIGEQRAGADACAALLSVDADRAHARQVDHQTALGHRVAGDMMAATTHAEQHSVRRGKAHRGLNILGREAARDQRRAAIDSRVPDFAGRVVSSVGGAECAAADLRCERCSIGLAQLPGLLV